MSILLIQASINEIVDLVFWRVRCPVRRTNNLAEEGGPIASIMTRLKLVKSRNALIKEIINLEIWRAQAMPNPNLNGARRGPGSDLSISLKLAPSADSLISVGILLKYLIHSFPGTRVRGVNSVEACVSGTSRTRLNTVTHRRNYGQAQVCKFLDNKTLSIWKSCERGA